MRYKLVYKNAVGSVEFSLESGIVIERIESLTQQRAKFQTTASTRQIGEKLDSQKVEPKTMTVSGTIIGESDAVRDQMMHVLSPLHEGTLTYNGEYVLTVFVKESPDIERYSHNARFSFSLFAPYPYWQRKAREQTTLVGLEPLFSFPWNISDPTPFRFSQSTPVGYVTVTNNGDAPAYWTIWLEALDEVTNPRVYNMETGEFVRILKTMVAGEKISITTQGDELAVTVTAPDGKKTNGFRFLDIDSMPFLLAVGENYIKTDAKAGTSVLNASITFKEGYTGV